MRSNHTVITASLTASLLVSLTAGCSLIKVNGKPLGGSSATTGSPSESASSTSSATDEPAETTSAPARKQNGNEDSPYAKCRDARPQDYQPCMDRVAADERKQRELAMSKQPAWCKEYHLHASSDVDLGKFKNITDAKRDLFSDAVAFAAVMCSVDGRNLEQRPKVMDIRTAWMKQHGLDEKDFLAAVSVQTRYVPDDQNLTALGPAVAQMDNTTALKLDQLGARTSMLGRIAYVESCMDPESAPPIGKILCAREPLDLGKALAEIEAAPSILPHMRLRLRLRARKVVAEQRRLNADLAALAKEEPAVGKLIAIADAQHKEWENPSPSRSKLMALAEQMEQATASNKRSAFQGCGAPALAAWSEVVRSRDLPAVDTKDTRDTMRIAVFTTAEAYLAYRALDLCVAGLSPHGRSSLGFSSSVVRRGPRTSTFAAWIAASGQIKFDSRDIDMGAVVRNGAREEGKSFAPSQSGTIAKLTPKGTYVLVEFQEVIQEYEECIAWKPTKQINKIDSSGNVYYVNQCTRSGMVKHDVSPEAVSIDPLFAAGLKPGMRLFTDGGAIVATANAKSSKPVWVFGVSLK